jgi:hypothetical protein
MIILQVVQEEQEKEVNLHQTLDARVWAKEFCKIFKDLYKHDIDEEWIIAWMANALMTGYDHMSWKRDKNYIYILQGNSGGIIKVFHYEPSIKDMNAAYAEYLGYGIDKINEVDAEFNCILYRWAKDKGLMVWDGKRDEPDTIYNWRTSV